MILQADARAIPLLDGCVQCVVTSPPYWGLRDYGYSGQLGLQQTPEQYVTDLSDVFDEVRRVLSDDGTCWVNLGDSYQSAKGQAHGVDPKQPARRRWLRPQDVTVPGLKPKDLVGVPWLFAFEARRRGWYLRSDIVWSKPNPMPESVTDRPTRAHEYIFLLSKSRRYYYDAANKRSVWTVATHPFAGAHFATMPEALVEPCILAGSRPGDLVFDPFLGSGTVGVVADRLMRKWVGTDLSYHQLAKERTAQAGLRLVNE